MNDRAARIAIMLGLAPWTVAAFGMLDSILGNTLKNTNELQLASASCTVFRCIVIVWIWRSYVRWNGTRNYLTATLIMLVLAHLILWRPIWGVQSCYLNPLICAQSCALDGLWGTGIALAWWGGHSLFRRRSTKPFISGGKRSMSPNSVRLTLGLALIPFLPGLYWIVGLVLSGFFPSEQWTVFTAYSICSVVLVSFWILLWRPVVEWTRARWILSGILALITLLAPFSTVLPAYASPWDVVRVMFPLVVAGIWFAGTALVWRSPASITNAAKDHTVLCPQCDYSLRGLREVRCPECGWSSTIDDVVQRALAVNADV
jgi:hypothetical protein